MKLFKYAGSWYEIQSFPNFFQNNLSCVKAIYNASDYSKTGKIGVTNLGVGR